MPRRQEESFLPGVFGSLRELIFFTPHSTQYQTSRPPASKSAPSSPVGQRKAGCRSAARAAAERTNPARTDTRLKPGAKRRARGCLRASAARGSRRSGDDRAAPGQSGRPVARPHLASVRHRPAGQPAECAAVAGGQRGNAARRPSRCRASSRSGDSPRPTTASRSW